MKVCEDDILSFLEETDYNTSKGKAFFMENCHLHHPFWWVGLVIMSNLFARNFVTFCEEDSLRDSWLSVQFGSLLYKRGLIIKKMAKFSISCHMLVMLWEGVSAVSSESAASRKSSLTRDFSFSSLSNFQNVNLLNKSQIPRSKVLAL